MLIVQISDTHIAGPGKLTCGVAPMAENLEACVKSINTLNPRPDLVLHSGDVTHDFAPGQARRAAEILSKLDCPFYLVPGNHDDRDVLRGEFGGTACWSQPEGFISFVIEGHPMRIIALDSLMPGASGGHVCAARLAWLRECLTQGGDRPTVIFMHHPPLRLGVNETDTDGFQGAELLGDLVGDFPNIERILCGHIHLPSHARWRGTIVTTAPSIGMQLALDLSRQEPSRFLLSDPAYLLHHWTPERVLVTHVIRLPAPDGPFEFT